MNALKTILAISLVMMMFVLPVAAEIGHHDGVDNSNDQLIGIKVDGKENTVVAVNDNSNGKTDNQYDIEHQTTDASSSAVYNILPDLRPTHYTLDTGAISSQVVSLYVGEVLTAKNDGTPDEDLSVAQHAGDKFQYTIKSSIPVLAYVINSGDISKTRSDDGAPNYLWWNQKYEHGGIAVVCDRNHMSTFQQFTCDIADDGNYALVVDTRTTQHLNGIQSPKGNTDTVDIFYSIEKLPSNPVVTTTPKMIGSINMYPIGAYGQAITS